MPNEIPADIDLFAVDSEKYPLLGQVENHILKATLEQGDCIYIPAFYWYQSKTLGEQSMLFTFGYESHSKLVDLLFDAINDGILDK